MSNNTENQNVISPNDDADNYDNMPSANTSERDGTNNKKLKLTAFVVIGILVMLIGVGLAMGRYSDSRSQAKLEEAEKAAQEQKKIAESGSVNIAKDKEVIQASTFHDLPAPSSLEAEGQGDVTAAEAAQQQPTIVQPTQQPQYNQYNQAAPQQPTEQVSPIQATQQPFIASATKTEAVEVSDVLVDVYGTAKALEAVRNGNQETGLANQFKSSKLMAGSVSKQGDTTMLLPKGTSIPCVLRTKIDSTYKGFTTCQLSKDVYSANGKVLLLERGSTVFGEQNVEIKQGQARVAVLWSRIETPNGVSVDIDSPAAGQLGEMGIDAKVKNHFWKRFGGAIMLSMIKDVSANASTNLAKDGQRNENTTQNTSSAAETMAEKALENTINIPPTATVNHGKLIHIMVIRDVDFGGIYELRKP